MQEDRLSPALGRLIDQAKAAAGPLGVEDRAVETVALLTEEGDIYTGAVLPSGGRVAADSGGPTTSAASLALERAMAAGAGEILAAAVVAPYDPAGTVSPRVASYERLVSLDPELPLVLKQHGRWVIVPADRVTPAS